MAKACPACGRPNSDTASRCLYCSKTILDSVGTITETLSVIAPAVSTPDRHLIILSPQSVGDIPASTIEAFAEVTGLTAYDARLALQTQKHRLLRKVNEEGDARDLSERLEELGVRHFKFAEEDVRALPVEPVRKIELGDRSLELALSDGRKLTIDYPNLLLLVRGEISRERHKKPKKASEGASRPLTPGLWLHIYSLDASIAAELDSDEFDWSALAEDQSPSTPINFKRLTDKILLRASQASLDRGFDMEPVVLSRSEPVSGIGEALQGSKESKGALYDNGAQFRFYARWRFLVERETHRMTSRDK
jgi:hypothetical protein